jgi:hypothetical protein
MLRSGVQLSLIEPIEQVYESQKIGAVRPPGRLGRSTAKDGLGSTEKRARGDEYAAGWWLADLSTSVETSAALGIFAAPCTNGPDSLDAARLSSKPGAAIVH